MASATLARSVAARSRPSTKARILVCSEQRPTPVLPHPHRLVTQVDLAFEQLIFHVPQAQWVLNVQQDHQADHFR